MKIVFALALNNDNVFEKKHFGDADKFVIHTFENKNLIVSEELPNTIKETYKDQHGSKSKGDAIIAALKEKDVSVLVSQQFGRNIKLVNQHFIPVIISEKKPEKALDILVKQMKWFKDELQNRQSGYMLFQINNGVLKSQVN